MSAESTPVGCLVSASSDVPPRYGSPLTRPSINGSLTADWKYAPALPLLTALMYACHCGEVSDTFE